MTKRERVEWLNYVLHRLNSYGHEWGCLSSDGKMFQICDFTHTDVPKTIINQLVNDGIIILENKINSRKQKVYYRLLSKIKSLKYCNHD